MLSTPPQVRSRPSGRPTLPASENPTAPSVQAENSQRRAGSIASPRGPAAPQPVGQRPMMARVLTSIASVSSRSSRFV